jgi:hypothetical protein
LALKWAISCVRAVSHINIYPKTPEVHEALRISSEIIDHGWESQTYCTVPQLVQLIQGKRDTCVTNCHPSSNLGRNLFPPRRFSTIPD